MIELGEIFQQTNRKRDALRFYRHALNREDLSAETREVIKGLVAKLEKSVQAESAQMAAWPSSSAEGGA